MPPAAATQPNAPAVPQAPPPPSQAAPGPAYVGPTQAALGQPGGAQPNQPPGVAPQYQQPVNVPPYPPSGSAPQYQQPVNVPPYPPSGSAPQYQQPGYVPPYPPPGGAQPVVQMGATGLSPFNFWGPFAGYGTRGRHVAWLLGTIGDRADTLRNAIELRFNARLIPDAVVTQSVLTGRGIVVEQRPYFLIQRKIATAGLYLARLGDDIYISQVTYARSPISYGRIAVLVMMLIFQTFFLIGGFGSAINSLSSSGIPGLGGGPDIGALARFVCCLGPLGLLNTFALLAAGLMTVWRTVTDKDPLAILRTSLNEFNQDDVIALEKAVEETVRECMDQVGIDRRLLPAAAVYGIRQRII
jgi:hypothetical protein